MKTIFKLLVLMLMSMMTSVAFAQAPKITENSAELNPENIAHITRVLKENAVIGHKDVQRINTLIAQKNTPINGVFDEAENYYIQPGDVYTAYISFERGCYWLAYYITRNGKFYIRYSERID